MTSEYRTEINLFAVKTDASAARDVDGFVVERIVKFGQAAIGTRKGCPTARQTRRRVFEPMDRRGKPT